MKLAAALCAGLALSVTAQSAGAVVPRPGPGDPRIFVVDFDPSEVVEIKGVLGYQLSLEFEPDEKIENVAIGDSLGWQVTPNRKANLLFLKPMALRPDTNMTVITNLRRYQFELSTRAKGLTKTIPYAIRFIYPPPAEALASASPPPPPVDRNHAYVTQGQAKILTSELFDDGEATYFAFPQGEDLPAIYALDADGKEALVNSHMRDRYVVVDRVARGFILRRGKETTKVLNQGFRVEGPGPLTPKQKPKDPWWRR